MGLREQLLEHLPAVLPADAKDAKTGTELIAELRKLVSGPYEDSSYRWQFSMLSSDPSSIIAKTAHGRGYFRRPDAAAASGAASSGGDAPAAEPVRKTEDAVIAPVESGGSEGGGGSTSTGRGDTPEEKFRSLYMLYARLGSQFPVHIEHTEAHRSAAGMNKWKFPDVLVVEWLVGDVVEGRFALDESMLEVRRSLGEQPLRLVSTELKVAATTSTFRESFFQCVSNSKWAHSAQLAVATPIDDSILQQELRRLGRSYGVTVVSYGIALDVLTALPPAPTISTWTLDAADAWFKDNATLDTVHDATDRTNLDWDHLRDLREVLPVASDVLGWIAKCLESRFAMPFDAFQALQEWTQRYGASRTPSV